MSLRFITLCMALTMLIASGCRSTRSAYPPATAPSVVAVAPVAPAPCPTPNPTPVPVPPPVVR